MALNIKFKQKNAKIVVPGEGGSWQGTPVPNSGLVENIYFNTALSNEEVCALMDSVIADGEIAYNLLFNDGHALGLVNYNGTYVIADEVAMKTYFTYPDTYGYGYVGWNPDFTNPESINGEVLSSHPSTGTPIGDKHDLISSLFSITPFGQGGSSESLPLSGEYDGSELEIKASYKPTLVPNSGLVDTVYFNTNLTKEEVDAILDTLTFDDDSNYRYLALANGQMFSIVKYADGYGIDYHVRNENGYSFTGWTVYNSSETENNFSYRGWNPDAADYVVINSEVIAEDSATGYTIGEQNDKLLNLMSITSYDLRESIVDLKALIEAGKIPLSIRFTLE